MRYQLTPIHCRPWTLSYLSIKLIESHYENNYGGALRRLNAITEQLESARLGEHAGPRDQRAQARRARRPQFDTAARALLREHGRRWPADRGDVGRAGARLRLRAAVERRVRRDGQRPRRRLRLGRARLSSARPPARQPVRDRAQPGHRRRHSDPGARHVRACLHLDYGANAKAYVDTFMRNVDWKALHARYEEAAKVGGLRPLEQPEFGDLPSVGVEEVKAMLDAGKPVQVVDARPRASVSWTQEVMQGATWRDPERVRNGSASCRSRSPWSCSAPTASTSGARPPSSCGISASTRNSCKAAIPRGKPSAAR